MSRGEKKEEAPRAPMRFRITGTRERDQRRCGGCGANLDEGQPHSSGYPLRGLCKEYAR